MLKLNEIGYLLVLKAPRNTYQPGETMVEDKVWGKTYRTRPPRPFNSFGEADMARKVGQPTGCHSWRIPSYIKEPQPTAKIIKVQLKALATVDFVETPL